MKTHRHPHPHLDPRQPRDGAQPGTNPPVFAWLPVTDGAPYRLEVARDPEFADLVLDVAGLRDSLYLPDAALAPGRYWWRWSGAGIEAETFAFDLSPSAAVVEVPGADEWLRRFSDGHPRLFLRPEDVAPLRASREAERAAEWPKLQAAADELLAQPHQIEEPPYLPDWQTDYRGAFAVWSKAMWDSRRFVQGAMLLGLAWLASGDARYARAACERMASIARWDPEGSSHIAHNDEAHMSVIWHGSLACDFVWDQFTDEERAQVIEQFRRRGQITYEHMHDRGAYGVSRFDSHAGREVVFLALLGLTFHEHIPEARVWLDWLRPVLCGVWPIWSGDDGAWAEGPSYGLAYVEIMTLFATALKRGTGVDLYQRPFWLNHARWRRWFVPPYAQWVGFGDHTERWAGSWQSAADLVELIARETGSGELDGYVAALRREAETMDSPPNRSRPGVSAQLYLSGRRAAGAEAAGDQPLLRVFPAAGQAALRTAPDDPRSDIAFLFRSSPYGSISHSHANNNDFILHVGGVVMAMPSGYYDGYGSDHHAHWVWHTKSHNCVTLSDAGQLMRSADSCGAVEAAHEDDALVYFRGTADASYADRARRCRRHVLYLKAHQAFVLVDEFAAQPGVVSALQWNLHGWAPFEVDEAARTFRCEREGSGLAGTFLWHRNAFFSVSEGWDPAPRNQNPQWHNQHHLRFTPTGLASRCTLGVVLCPGFVGRAPAAVTTEREGATEVAHLGADRVMVNPAATLDDDDRLAQPLITLALAGRLYTVDDDGLRNGG